MLTIEDDSRMLMLTLPQPITGTPAITGAGPGAAIKWQQPFPGILWRISKYGEHWGWI